MAAALPAATDLSFQESANNLSHAIVELLRGFDDPLYFQKTDFGPFPRQLLFRKVGEPITLDNYDKNGGEATLTVTWYDDREAGKPDYNMPRQSGNEGMYDAPRQKGAEGIAKPSLRFLIDIKTVPDIGLRMIDHQDNEFDPTGEYWKRVKYFRDRFKYHAKQKGFTDLMTTELLRRKSSFVPAYDGETYGTSTHPDAKAFKITVTRQLPCFASGSRIENVVNTWLLPYRKWGQEILEYHNFDRIQEAQKEPLGLLPIKSRTGIEAGITPQHYLDAAKDEALMTGFYYVKHDDTTATFKIVFQGPSGASQQLDMLERKARNSLTKAFVVSSIVGNGQIDQSSFRLEKIADSASTMTYNLFFKIPLGLPSLGGAPAPVALPAPAATASSDLTHNDPDAGGAGPASKRRRHENFWDVFRDE